MASTRFREPDPTRGGVGTVPADHLGRVLAVAANAGNDAWAATNQGYFPSTNPSVQAFYQRPHLYRLTDSARPTMPAGDDEEDRPIEVVSDPPIFVEQDPPPEPPPPPEAPPAVAPPAPKDKRVNQKAAVYRPQISKPRRLKGDRYVMVVRFRVRRPVTIGVEALRGKRVVGRSGLKRFSGKRGSLKVEINRKRWPTRVRFYTRSGSTG